MDRPSTPPLDTIPATPPPAVLHPRIPESHPDTEESVARERQHVALELEPVVRSRNVPARASSGCRTSQATTAPDSLGPTGRHVRTLRLRRQVPRWFHSVVKFWTTQITVTIDEGPHRDHLALERTFLGYLRTSLAFSVTGVIIAQLFRLQDRPTPGHAFHFFALGIPLAATFIAFAIVVLCLGAFRVWRQQNAMIRGKVHAGGWELSVLMLGSLALCLALFVLVVVVSILND